jgi:hypothetical protein
VAPRGPAWRGALGRTALFPPAHLIDPPCIIQQPTAVFHPHRWRLHHVHAPLLPPSLPLAQLDSLGSDTNQLSVNVGTAVLLATCTDLLPPTMFNLIGAMAVDRAMQSMRLNGSGGAAPGLLPVPALTDAASGDAVSRVLADGPLLGSTAEVNPMAATALRVLHPDELAAALSPLGGHARPMTIDEKLEEPTQPGQWLVRAHMTWRCTQPEDDAAMAAEEERVWQEVAQPAAAPPRDDDALHAALEPLLALRRRSGMALSPRLVQRLLMLAGGALRLQRRLGCLHGLPLPACPPAFIAHAEGRAQGR